MFFVPILFFYGLVLYLIKLLRLSPEFVQMAGRHLTRYEYGRARQCLGEGSFWTGCGHTGESWAVAFCAFEVGVEDHMKEEGDRTVEYSRLKRT